MKGLLVVLVLPSLASLSWRIPGPGLSNPIREITSRLFHMGQTMARMVGALSGNYPSPHYNHYQHYHHHLGRLRVKSILLAKSSPATPDNGLDYPEPQYEGYDGLSQHDLAHVSPHHQECREAHLSPSHVSKILVTSLTDLL